MDSRFSHHRCTLFESIDELELFQPEGMICSRNIPRKIRSRSPDSVSFFPLQGRAPVSYTCPHRAGLDSGIVGAEEYTIPPRCPRRASQSASGTSHIIVVARRASDSSPARGRTPTASKQRMVELVSLNETEIEDGSTDLPWLTGRCRPASLSPTLDCAAAARGRRVDRGERCDEEGGTVDERRRGRRFEPNWSRNLPAVAAYAQLAATRDRHGSKGSTFSPPAGAPLACPSEGTDSRPLRAVRVVRAVAQSLQCARPPLDRLDPE